MNSLFNALGGGNPLGQFGNMMKQFQQFRNTFKGDPRQQVQQLLNSGKITQEQYNRAVNMANEMYKMLR